MPALFCMVHADRSFLPVAYDRQVRRNPEVDKIIPGDLCPLCPQGQVKFVSSPLITVAFDFNTGRRIGLKPVRIGLKDLTSIATKIIAIIIKIEVF